MTAIYIGVIDWHSSMDGVVILFAASFDPLQLHATLTLSFDPDLRDGTNGAHLSNWFNEIDQYRARRSVALAKMIGEGIDQLD